MGVGSYHLDRIRMKLPRTSVEGFERPGRSLYGLRRASRITDINPLLQALEWVPVRAEQSLKEDLEKEWARQRLNQDIYEARPCRSGPDLKSRWSCPRAGVKLMSLSIWLPPGPLHSTWTTKVAPSRFLLRMAHQQFGEPAST